LQTCSRIFAARQFSELTQVAGFARAHAKIRIGYV